jgi:hypothetical protein
MGALGCTLAATAAVWALLAGAAFSAAKPAAHGSVSRLDACPRSRDLYVGPTRSAYFSTVAPFEHFDSQRTLVFPATCTLSEIAGPGPVKILEHEAPNAYATPYVPITRGRSQVYIYGVGQNPQTDGGFVARVNPVTLAQRWRTTMKAPPPAQWSYPGVMLVNGKGLLYAIYANVLVKLDPITGRTLARLVLPENPKGYGAAYNGMVILPDGRIVAKGIERGPCDKSSTFAGLQCASKNGLPSPVVVVDPNNLKILSHFTSIEPITGRIASGSIGHTVYVYMAQRNNLVRYRYQHSDGTLQLDKGWGPVRYRTGEQTPGTAPGLLGKWAVLQTNFLPSTAPMTVTAVNIFNSKRVFRIRPFARATHVLGHSFELSKAALDYATDNVYTEDSGVEELVGMHFDPNRGFRILWRDRVESLEFVALIGPAAERQLVFTDYYRGGDHVIWLDAATGRILARSGVLAHAPAPGNLVMPGFGGRFYYAGNGGQLWVLRPVHAGH